MILLLIRITVDDILNMKKTINAATFCALIMLACNCAPPQKHNLLPEPKTRNLNSTTFMQNIPKIIEKDIPEFRSISMKSGVPSSGQTWRQGKEYARAAFILQNNTRYHPAGEFPRETTPVPYMDIEVIVTRFASSSEAQDNLKKELRLRQATPSPKEYYKGALLIRYASGGGTVICQSEQYIVEINPFVEAARPLTLKLLDTVLEQIKSDSSKVD